MVPEFVKRKYYSCSFKYFIKWHSLKYEKLKRRIALMSDNILQKI